MLVRSFCSTPTALTLTRSCDSCNSGRVSKSSALTVSTVVSGRLSWRAASRRNADFLVFDSTMTRWSDGIAIFSGMAGDPPPEPMSSSRGCGPRCGPWA